MLDGSPEEQRRSTEKFLSMLTEEEKERAMSSEFDYLDEDQATFCNSNILIFKTRKSGTV